MLLIWAGATRHETWGILGAIDDDDQARIESLVEDFRYMKIPGGHEIHMRQPERYIEEIISFVESLLVEGRLEVSA